jgi:hypothetical protein
MGGEGAKKEETMRQSFSLWNQLNLCYLTLTAANAPTLSGFQFGTLGGASLSAFVRYEPLHQIMSILRVRVSPSAD